MGSLIISKLEGFSGLKLRDETTLEIKQGINLLVGRNGSGKTNLLSLIHKIYNNKQELSPNTLESSLLRKIANNIKTIKRDSQGENIRKGDFGKIAFCNFSLNEVKGKLIIELLKDMRIDHFERSIRMIGMESNDFIINNASSDRHEVLPIYPSTSHREIGIRVFKSYNPLSAKGQENDRQLVNETVENFNHYFYEIFREFIESEGFTKKIKDLEINLNKKYRSFLGQTRKSIEINFDDDLFNGDALVLKDGENFYSFNRLSDGERVLLNLIFSLTTARDKKPELITFDEPEIYMHDDMIKQLVKELEDLVSDLPECKFIVSTHSSALIEEIANLGKKKVSLIIIDDKKQVYNSDNEIDYINILVKNGVWFSPLMLSKKPNIFIENQGSKGIEYKDFFLKFFDIDCKPNIIPIGSSDRVATHESFSAVLNDIVGVSEDTKTVGVMDGDIWIKKYLIKYFEGEKELDDLINLLAGYGDFYIPDKRKSNLFYFNCWEIENLYLIDDLLPFWNNGHQILNEELYKKLLYSQKSEIIKQYVKTYLKSVLRIRYYDGGDMNEYSIKVQELTNKVEALKVTIESLQVKADKLLNGLIENELLNWVPGKEVRKKLLKEYSLQIDRIDFDSLKMTKAVREILEL